LGYTYGPERHRKDGHWYLSAKLIDVNYSCRSATIILAGQSQVLFVLPSMNGPPVWGGARGG